MSTIGSQGTAMLAKENKGLRSGPIHNFCQSKLRCGRGTVLLGLALGRWTSSCDTESSTVEERDDEVELRVWGEDGAELGFGPEVFVDGWSVQFREVLVGIRDVSVQGVAGPEFVPGQWAYDLARASGGQGHYVTQFPASLHANSTLAYRVATLDPSEVGGSAEATQTEELFAAGAALIVEGTATRGEVQKHFRWAFSNGGAYEACVLEAPATGTASVREIHQLTLHFDHLFYDDLDGDRAQVAFDLIAAADVDGDGEVTQAELTAVPLAGQARYQVGNRSDIADLGAFVAAQAQTIGHIDGEGHCDGAAPHVAAMQPN